MQVTLRNDLNLNRRQSAQQGTLLTFQATPHREKLKEDIKHCRISKENNKKPLEESNVLRNVKGAVVHKKRLAAITTAIVCMNRCE